ncbi:hypothetical protein SAMN05444161_4007 [Rhizobiales bacterium GAS191]|nr:hypothetical protein SAMN05519103_03123 [Rhizobiales bacterium GAS113]SED78706.1 hypothetical protein SAMN05444161_4007 [Rhizobiales bacterium GAS191]
MTERMTPPLSGAPLVSCGDGIERFHTIEVRSSILGQEAQRRDVLQARETRPINTSMCGAEMFVTGLAAVVLVIGFATAEFDVPMHASSNELAFIMPREGLGLGRTGGQSRAPDGIGVNRRDDVSDMTQEVPRQRVVRPWPSKPYELNTVAWPRIAGNRPNMVRLAAGARIDLVPLFIKLATE